MAYEVQKGILGKIEMRGRKTEYPFASMEIGDFFDVPIIDAGMRKQPTAPIMNAARYYRIYAGQPNFRAACTTKARDGFVRCQRIA